MWVNICIWQKSVAVFLVSIDITYKLWQEVPLLFLSTVWERNVFYIIQEMCQKNTTQLHGKMTKSRQESTAARILISMSLPIIYNSTFILSTIPILVYPYNQDSRVIFSILILFLTPIYAYTYILFFSHVIFSASSETSNELCCKSMFTIMTSQNQDISTV